MSVVRYLSYKDYGLSDEEIKYILSYCRSDRADKELIKQASEQVNIDLAGYLYQSVMHKESYEKLGRVPISKGDFYAYRRRLLARLKKELIEQGELIVIDGKIWSWGLVEDVN